jgi:hypothetical protein
MEDEKVWMYVDNISGNTVTLTIKLNTADSSHFLNRNGYITKED